MSYLEQLFETGYSFLNDDQKDILEECLKKTKYGLSLPMGMGKCHAYNTKILMYDGSISYVQDIQEGQLLMGDDSKPRKVLSLGSGEDDMYEIIPESDSFERYTFNSEHILCLKFINTEVVHEIKIKDLYDCDFLLQYLEIYRVTINFNISEEARNLKLEELKKIDINQSKEYYDYLLRYLGLTKENRSKFTIVKKPVDNYYGFEIDANNRFLLGDFSVTHNTIISLEYALSKKISTRSQEPILIVVSKSLVSNWIIEIEKFFGQSLKYQIMNVNSKKFILKDDTLIVLVTPDLIGKYYTSYNIRNKLITIKKVNILGTNLIKDEINYIIPTKPFLEDTSVEYITTTTTTTTTRTRNLDFGEEEEVADDEENITTPSTTIVTDKYNGCYILFSKKWSTLIIDEGHKYTNIETIRCKALISVFSDNRVINSGTIFEEPTVERILGYYLTLHITPFPTNIADTHNLIRFKTFKGFKDTLVERQKTELVDTVVHKEIISHDLTTEEGQIYLTAEKTLRALNVYCKTLSNTEDRQKFSSYILTVIGIIRQCVVVPMVSIANIALEMADITDSRSELSVILMDEFKKLNIQTFLNDENSLRSSRIKKIIELIKKHNKPTDKIIIFSCFCTSLDTLDYYIDEDIGEEVIDKYHMKSEMSINARGSLIESFKDSEKNSVLLSTFTLAAEGLNMQFANVVIIIDFWWNSAKTQQAVSRIVRRGQKAKDIYVYFLTANTGIENILFQKQQDKLLLIDELKVGKAQHFVKTFKIDEILLLLDIEANKSRLSKVM